MVIAGERRCVGVTRRVCEYASRQCKIIYAPCWRNRHRSAPARSGYGHHVKCGSCDMPLRSAKSRSGQHRSVGRAWSVWDQDGAFVCRGEERLLWPRSGRRARGCWLLAACLRRVNPRERSNGTREWNGLEQAIDGWCLTLSRSWEFVRATQAARGDEQPAAATPLM